MEVKKLNPHPKIIDKTCQYPGYLINFKINPYHFFDKIFIQTPTTNLSKYTIKTCIKYPIESPYNVINFQKYCQTHGLESKIDYSEMTFQKIQDQEIPLAIDQTKINLVYMGRLMGGNGMDLMFLMKLMKQLGSKYMLYIIPGSFLLPNQYPPKKKSAKRESQYLELKTFFENYKLDYNEQNLSPQWNEKNFQEEETDCSNCNIKVFPQYEYGQHFNILREFDIGLGFSNKKDRIVPEGSAKLFDYMNCKLKIVFENGWSNCDYITKYKFGKVISTNSTIKEFIDAIKEVEQKDSSTILYDQFYQENNYLTRAKEILHKLESLDYPRILVTGCAGFIGSHLTERLLQLPYRVYGIDNINDYYDKSQKHNNLEILQKYPNFYFRKDDIITTTIINEIKPQIVINLAAMAGVRNSLENPAIYMRTNIEGLTNLLNQASKNQTKLFIYASSSSVYGLNSKVPFSESDPINQPNSPYAASKASGEIIANLYHRLYNLPTIGLRFFTVYGPRGRPDMAPYKFLTKIMQNKKFDKYGEGHTFRDYTYIDDIINGILGAIRNKNNRTNEIYNLGNSETVSLNEFIETCEKVTNKTAIYNQLPDQKGDVPKTYADITKANEDLDYNPQVKIEEGLTKMFNWLKLL